MTPLWQRALGLPTKAMYGINFIAATDFWRQACQTVVFKLMQHRMPDGRCPSILIYLATRSIPWSATIGQSVTILPEILNLADGWYQLNATMWWPWPLDNCYRDIIAYLMTIGLPAESESSDQPTETLASLPRWPSPRSSANVLNHIGWVQSYYVTHTHTHTHTHISVSRII